MTYVFACGRIVTLLSGDSFVIKDMTGKTLAYGKVEHVEYRSHL